MSLSRVFFWILGFFLPLVGIILYFALREDNIQNAKSCRAGAVFSICAGVILLIVLIAFGVLATMLA